MSSKQIIENVYEQVLKRNPGETEFHQAVKEVLESLPSVLDENPEYVEARILERIVEPERIIIFRVPWTNDKGNTQVNRGFRVQFNSALGPYKGGLRFHPSVNLGILKFLAFEQVFKNSLTTLPMGGGKGGSDFDPKGKSDNEVMKFCQSFMNELFRYIGPNTDVPAGDIGVGKREIGYLFGQYKKLKNEFTGVFTGKGINWGGSLIRPEATGFGAVYFVQEMLKLKNETLEGKNVVLSGFGNVAWGVALKITELGGKVITLSGPDGYIYDKDGVKGEKINYMLQLRASNNDRVEDYAKKFGVPFYAGKRPWEVKCDLALPCATQNELDINDAKTLISNGCILIAEISNMGCTADAAKLATKKIMFAPGKAANAGGVATSGLEMSQNSMRLTWTSEETDKHLLQIMKNIHETCLKYGQISKDTIDYVKGANIGGFVKVADAMLDQGLV
ncbi:MAG: NADP-specific glutamate dehydrogenase [Candidatus Ratteibacteria bacterium]|nr:NADP-specific glutamate dehydrogenase [Candidatus Ratteibacteria bacterium]